MFKRVIATLLLTVGLTAVANARDDASWWFSIGKSEDGAPSYALAGKFHRFGMAAGWVTNYGGISGYTEDSPVPHNDYEIIGEGRSMTLGADVVYFPIDEEKFKLYVGVGYYSQNKWSVARSNVTGWTYKQREWSETTVSQEIGIQFRPAGDVMRSTRFGDVKESSVTFGLSFHTVRGPNFTVGWTYW